VSLGDLFVFERSSARCVRDVGADGDVVDAEFLGGVVDVVEQRVDVTFISHHGPCVEMVSVSSA